MIIKEMREVRIDMTDEEREVLLEAADLLNDLMETADEYLFDEITLISAEDSYEEYFELNAEYDFLPKMMNTLQRFSRGKIIMKKDELPL